MSLIVVDKPAGMTSFAVVRRVRSLLGKAFGQKGERVGHGGTLDPFASGVLPVCVGEGTKVLPFLLDADKRYDAVVRFGVDTDTLDLTGKVVAEHPVDGLSVARLEAALARFRGPIAQVPPMYSALKRGGKPLYQYARAGLTVERAPRPVTIHALELVGFDPPDQARLHIRCSKGTYIRSLAADLGAELGVGAHLVALRRTRSGPFSLEQAVTLEELARRVAAGEPVPTLPLLQALAHLPQIPVDEPVARALGFGQRVDWNLVAAGRTSSGPVAAVRPSPEGPSLIAMVARDEDGTAKVLRGFRPGTR